MAASQKRLKNDPDRRMDKMALSVQVDLQEKDLQALNRKDLDYWIAELRRGETSVRHLRERLEALQNEVQRTCPVCDRPVVGRADAIYCNSLCRVRAHRKSKL